MHRLTVPRLLLNAAMVTSTERSFVGPNLFWCVDLLCSLKTDFWQI